MDTAMAGARRQARASGALRAAAGFWFVVAVAGQVLFALATASLYGRAALRGDLLEWDRFMTHGYVAGHGADNAAVTAHVVLAVLITLAGALQLTPAMRRRAPALHRWNGRFYFIAAFAISLSGLWMVWVRGTPGDLSMHLGISLNAVLIMLFATLAVRRAMAGDLAAHRRWALRLFIVVSGVWFLRVWGTLSFVMFGGSFGFNPRTFVGPFLTFLSFAAYLLPLAVLELYLRAQSGGVRTRLAMAGGLGALTLGMGAGVAATAMGLWLPSIAAPFAGRPPVSEALSTIIGSEGVDAALRRYQGLRASGSGAYDVGEAELNVLGYELVHACRLGDAIRVFGQNVTAYPLSANVYDSLGEAYMDAGDTARATANYRRSLQLNPANHNAADALRELGAP